MTLELLRSLLHLHQVQIVLGQVSKTNDRIIAETKNSKKGIMVYTNSFSKSAKLEQMGQQPDKFQ